MYRIFFFIFFLLKVLVGQKKVWLKFQWTGIKPKHVLTASNLFRRLDVSLGHHKQSCKKKKKITKRFFLKIILLSGKCRVLFKFNKSFFFWHCLPKIMLISVALGYKTNPCNIWLKFSKCPSILKLISTPIHSLSTLISEWMIFDFYRLLILPYTSNYQNHYELVFVL